MLRLIQSFLLKEVGFYFLNLFKYYHNLIIIHFIHLFLLFIFLFLPICCSFLQVIYQCQQIFSLFLLTNGLNQHFLESNYQHHFTNFHIIPYSYFLYFKDFPNYFLLFIFHFVLHFFHFINKQQELTHFLWNFVTIFMVTQRIMTQFGSVILIIQYYYFGDE